VARARNIKPSFFDNEKLASLCPHTRLLFIGLWTIADAYGKLEDRPARIKNQILGYENVDAELLLKNLEQSGFIERYSVGGQNFIRIPNFIKHQHQHPNELRKQSEFPDPVQVVDSKKARNKSGKNKINPDNNGAHGPLNESPLLNPESPLPQVIGQQADRFEDFFSQYPKKVKRKTANEIWRRKNLNSLADQIIQDIAMRLSSDRRWLDGFIPDPTTYLNQERWNDELSIGGSNAKSGKKYSVWDQLNADQQSTGGKVVVLPAGGDLQPEIYQLHHGRDGTGSG
jgi:hypothetical protein